MNMRRFTIFNVIGLILLLAAVRLGYLAVQEYQADLTRRDWPQTTAVVTEVESWQERVTSGTKKHRRVRYETFYNVTYAYEIDEVSYVGRLERYRSPYTQGETMQIKYDPEDHTFTTVRLEASVYDLVVQLAACALFGVAGFFTSGLWAWQRRCRGREDEDE